MLLLVLFFRAERKGQIGAWGYPPRIGRDYEKLSSKKKQGNLYKRAIRLLNYTTSGINLIIFITFIPDMVFFHRIYGNNAMSVSMCYYERFNVLL